MKILYIILGVIALILLIAAILPKKMKLSATTTINTSPEKVWEYVKLLANQKNFSVRVLADPNIKLTYWGIDGTVGATQARDSNDKNVGKGEQEITSIDEGKSYEVEIRFERPMQATNYAKTILTDGWSGTTIVTNTFRGVTPRPFNLMSYAFAPKLRKDMQHTMDNLKKELEK